MEEDRYVRAAREQRGVEGGGWKPSVAVFLGMALLFLLLILVIVLGVTTGMGFVFAIPLLLIAIIIPFLIFTGALNPRAIRGLCPYCGARVRTRSHLAEFSCPKCGKQIEVKEGQLQAKPPSG